MFRIIKHSFAVLIAIVAVSIVACASIVKNDTGGSTNTNTTPYTNVALYSYGPAITFSGGSLTDFTLSYYTDYPTTDALILQFSNSNITLQENDPNSFHHFNFHLVGDSTNFTYTINTRDTLLSNRSGTINAPFTNRYHFVAYGDSRSQYDVHSNVSKAISTAEPDFIIHVGDFVGNGQDMNEWRLYFDSAQKALSNSVIIPVNGNHDNHSPMLTNMFNPSLAGFYYYSLAFPGLRIIVLDNSESYLAGSAQYTWLTNELRQAGSGWKIVAFHNAPFTSGNHYTDADKTDLTNVLVPALVQYQVQLVLNGHDHLYERSTNSNITFLTVGAGGAPLYTPVYSNPYKVAIVSGVYSFALIDIVSNFLDVKVYDTNLVLLDSFSITN